MEHSEQTWDYDVEGEWLISEETVGTIGNEAEASVVVTRPLGTSPFTPKPSYFLSISCP